MDNEVKFIFTLSKPHVHLERKKEEQNDKHSTIKTSGNNHILNVKVTLVICT